MLRRSIAVVFLIGLSVGAATESRVYGRDANRKTREAFEHKNFGPSLGYRPAPPVVRRQVFSHVKYDPTKWISEPDMTIAQAIMFDRTPALSVDECLHKCTTYQNPSSQWICRSLTYDRKWQLCDLFAIDGSTSPFFLSEYRHRDYFKYLAALPPSDRELKTNSSTERSNEMREKEVLETTTSHSQEFVEASVQPTELPSISAETNLADVKLKVLGSKQTGDAKIVAVAEESKVVTMPFGGGKEAAITSTTIFETEKPTTTSVESPSTTPITLTGFRKPSLKFAIVPIAQTSSASPMDAIEDEIKSVTAAATTTAVPSPTSSSEEVITTKTTSTTAPEMMDAVQHFVTEGHSTPTNEPIEVEPTKSTEKPTEKPTHEKPLRKKIQGVPTQNFGDNHVPVVEQPAGCSNSEETRYVSIKNAKRKNEADEIASLDRTSAEACAIACTTHGVECLSASFSHGRCQLWASKVNHGVEGELIETPKSWYVERVCIPAQHATGNKRTAFEAIRNQILVGFVQEVTDAPTLSQCQSDCLRAPETYGFVCKSAMWYPSDSEQNCLLNSESRHTKSESFVGEDETVNMLYLEIEDEKTIQEQEKTMSERRYKNLDSPIQKESDQQWTKWSKCVGSNATMRHRYQRCKEEKDVRKCPKESIACGKQLRQIQIRRLGHGGECRAVRDAFGNKKCPHGVRLGLNGGRHYCIHPVDC
ncbi:hypothetical protein M3Y99_00882400 [Aphelenchoides fujianensis]|nr:hypothetical protein M3Y99_00882400 [Aphelenchoides fujianensis]